MKRYLIALVIGWSLVSGLPASAHAAANPNASCNGVGSSALGPQGLRDDAAHQVQAYADATGTTPGAIYSAAAQQHLGDVAACLAA